MKKILIPLIVPFFTFGNINGVPNGDYILQSKSIFLSNNYIFKIDSNGNKKTIEIKLKNRSQCTGCKIGYIEGFQKINKEYLYGHIKFPDKIQTRRCKFWSKGDFIFLRIYGIYKYHTFKMSRK